MGVGRGGSGNIARGAGCRGLGRDGEEGRGGLGRRLE